MCNHYGIKAVNSKVSVSASGAISSRNFHPSPCHDPQVRGRLTSVSNAGGAAERRDRSRAAAFATPSATPAATDAQANKASKAHQEVASQAN